MLYEDLRHEILGAAMEVYRELGPGLLESVYESCMCYELSVRRIPFQRQLEVPVFYKGIRMESELKLDIIADQRIILEIKCVQEIHPVFEAQLLTYLKLMNIRVGILLNFNVPVMKDGVVRRVR